MSGNTNNGNSSEENLSPAVGRRRPLPAMTIVPVRSYAGETDRQALERLGMANGPSPADVVFLHLC